MATTASQQQQAQQKHSQHPKNKKLFPQKLWDLINDDRYNFCLRWSEDGQLVYLNRDDFEDSYLKTAENQFHTQKAISFVRQMNMYGFRKVDDCYYENDNFKRGCEHLLKNMIRKHPNKPIQMSASPANAPTNASLLTAPSTPTMAPTPTLISTGNQFNDISSLIYRAAAAASQQNALVNSAPLLQSAISNQHDISVAMAPQDLYDSSPIGNQNTLTSRNQYNGITNLLPSLDYSNLDNFYALLYFIQILSNPALSHGGQRQTGIKRKRATSSLIQDNQAGLPSRKIRPWIEE